MKAKKNLHELYGEFEIEKKQQVHLEGGIYYFDKTGDPTTYTSPGHDSIPPDTINDCEIDPAPPPPAGTFHAADGNLLSDNANVMVNWEM